MILIGLGANLHGKYGSPAQALQSAVYQLNHHHDIKVISVSSVWKSAPVPVSDQPWYRNAVCAIETSLSPEALLEVIADIEMVSGRERTQRNAARVLDLDLLAYDKRVINTQNLTVPHPRMHERAFVLYPLQEIAPSWLHPIQGKSVDNLIENMPKGQEILRQDCLYLFAQDAS